jgi:pantothenate kinase
MSTRLQQDNVAKGHLTLTPEAAVPFLVQRADAMAEAAARRVLIGIAGGPGAGKSTIAADVVEALNAARPGVAALVPMDGFHMRHKKLEGLGTVRDKGAPHTFEGAAFAAYLASLKAATGPINGPSYSRQIEDVVDNAFVVPGTARILIVEGNYLLLANPPWDAVKPLLDLAVFIHLDREKVRARLMKRHAEAGLFSEERNREHIARVDLANYDLIELSAPRADLQIDIDSEK